MERFAEAYRLYPSPKIHYNLGLAYALLPGHQAQSYQEMSLFITEAADADAEVRAAAEAKLRALRSEVALATVVAAPANAALLVDGINVGSAKENASVVLGRGTHSLILASKGRISEAKTLVVIGGETFEAHLEIPAPARDEPVAAPVVLPPAPQAGYQVQGTIVPPSAGSPVVAKPATAEARGGLSPKIVLDVPPGPATPVVTQPVAPRPTEPAPPNDAATDAKPIYKSRWFWATMAGIVVAGSLTAIALSAGSTKDPTPTMGLVKGN